MLEGLEAVEIRFSTLDSIIDYRIEPEFFEKRFLSLESYFGKTVYKSFFEIANYENGRAFSSESFNDENYGIRISKIGDVRNERAIETWDCVDFEEFSTQKGNYLANDDILMSLTGDPPDIGKVNLIFEPKEKATWNQRVARIFLRENQESFINPKVFYIVLKSKYCREQLERYAKGIRQRNLGIDCIELLKVPIFSENFQLEIYKKIQNSFNFLTESQSLYRQAEELLLEELGLKDWQPTNKNTAEKTFANSFLESGRLDAEYYQPKYDELEEKIRSNNVGRVQNPADVEPTNVEPTYIKKIAEIEVFNARGLQPIYVEGGTLDIINSKHILESTLDYENFEKTDASFWESQARGRVYRNDILTYTTGANIGRTQVYLSDKQALASNHVNILRINEGNPIYVAFVINSFVGRLQTEKLSAGSAQQELYPKDLTQFYIPFIAVEHQNKIEELIIESENLKTLSKQLLAIAKRGVEIAIEQDEAAALAWIDLEKK